MTDRERSFELSLPLPASPEELWRALTDAGELVRWFPLEAAVEPGAGGRAEWVWRDFFRWSNRIEVWEPGKKLTLVEEPARPFEAAGSPLTDGSVESARIAIELTIEREGDASRLRLVHSGFGRGAAWDDELDSVAHGWAFELRSLAHYLAHHRGRERAVAFVAQSTPLDLAALRERLRTAGWRLPWTGVAAGDRIAVDLPTGDRFHGRVITAVDGCQLALTADELGNGLLRIESWRAGGGSVLMLSAARWIAPAAPAGGEAAALEARLAAAVRAAVAG